VVFEPAAARAWWFRYTTFAPAPGEPGAPRGTVWAAAFDAHGIEPALAGKSILAATPGSVRLGDALFENGHARGEVRARGHLIAWDLHWIPGPAAVQRAPWILDRLPLPTQVAHAGPDLALTGWVAVDGARRALDGAPGVQKHIWGTRRVEELAWLYCPRFEGATGASLEATAVRAQRSWTTPRLTFVWARNEGRELDWCGLPFALTNRLEYEPGTALAFDAASPLHGLHARACCDPRTLAGYVYRDPSGFDLYVAQSDVASCEMTLRMRPHPLAAWHECGRFTAREAAALEFHGPEPIPGVRYLGWDETGA
jgi:hypothetical protein